MCFHDRRYVHGVTEYVPTFPDFAIRNRPDMEFDDRFASDAPFVHQSSKGFASPYSSGCSETMSRFQFAVNFARYRADDSVIG